MFKHLFKKRTPVSIAKVIKLENENGPYLSCDDDSYEATLSLKESITNSFATSPEHSGGGSIGVGEVFDRYELDQEWVQLAYDEGFGYTITANSENVLDQVINQITAGGCNVIT